MFAESAGAHKPPRLEAVGLQRLAAYRWPGSLCEWRSVLRTIAALAELGDDISVEQLPLAIRDPAAAALHEAARRPGAEPDEPLPACA